MGVRAKWLLGGESERYGSLGNFKQTSSLMTYLTPSNFGDTNQLRSQTKLFFYKYFPALKWLLAFSIFYPFFTVFLPQQKCWLVNSELQEVGFQMLPMLPRRLDHLVFFAGSWQQPGGHGAPGWRKNKIENFKPKQERDWFIIIDLSDFLFFSCFFQWSQSRLSMHYLQQSK